MIFMMEQISPAVQKEVMPVILLGTTNAIFVMQEQTSLRGHQKSPSSEHSIAITNPYLPVAVIGAKKLAGNAMDAPITMTVTVTGTGTMAMNVVSII